jgi:hypothetical protein
MASAFQGSLNGMYFDGRMILMMADNTNHLSEFPPANNSPETMHLSADLRSSNGVPLSPLILLNSLDFVSADLKIHGDSTCLFRTYEIAFLCGVLGIKWNCQKSTSRGECGWIWYFYWD